MGEFIPVFLGFCAGCILVLIPNGSIRKPCGFAAILFAGLAATLASGEYHSSWVYLLIDLSEAVAGFVAGLAVLMFADRMFSRPERRSFHGNSPAL